MLLLLSRYNGLRLIQNTPATAAATGKGTCGNRHGTPDDGSLTCRECWATRAHFRFCSWNTMWYHLRASLKNDCEVVECSGRYEHKQNSQLYRGNERTARTARTDRPTDRPTDPTDRPDRPTNRPTNRPTDRHTTSKPAAHIICRHRCTTPSFSRESWRPDQESCLGQSPARGTVPPAASGQTPLPFAQR